MMITGMIVVRLMTNKCRDNLRCFAIKLTRSLNKTWLFFGPTPRIGTVHLYR